MESRILLTMAADLGIYRYENESETQYCNRVLYSAMASWIKASALDRLVTSVQTDNTGVSRRHILDKCTSILSEMLKRFPESKRWFETESVEENPIAILLSRLIRHGDLLHVGFETNLILAGSSQMPLLDSLECRKGAVLIPEMYYSGVAMLQKTQRNKLYKPEVVTDVVTWFEDYVRSAWWKEAGIDGNIQYFNAYKRARNNYSCWQLERPEPVNDLWLVRRNISRDWSEYFLLREEDCLYTHQIDPFLQKIGEHRRFMIVMRHMAENEVPVQIYHYTDHILVKLRIHLPQKESSLLETYAWPHNTFKDKLEWDMDEDVWRYIKPHLYGLRLELTDERKYHG
ncbi:MAG: hypothetical protein HFG49_16180 [Lachnospiraceae bacterium]|nr:hypothetical protein [Lachnospiraceae bacterium]